MATHIKDTKMALSTKIKHVDKRPNGVLRFRRRFPKDVVEVLGEPALQVHIKNREGLAVDCH